jgi:general secretion pathway protein G
MMARNRIRRLGRAAARGVTLVEVLIVLAIMAIIAGGATALVFPRLKESRVKAAVLSAGEIKKTAMSYIEIDLNGNMDKCPSVQDLVDAKRLEKGKTDDPWGQPFKVHCGDGDISVTSSGADRKEGTPDDIKDDFRPADVDRVAKM